MSLTFGSCFTGVGGIDLGFERAGLVCRWQIEVDAYCRRVLAKHWPDVRRYEDIRDVGPELEHVDVICGGDPCQANSNAGSVWKRQHADIGGEFLRVVAACRPRIVLRENPSTVRPDAPWPWWRFRAGLEGLGYAVVPFRLRACCFGLDHRRDRLFLLAALPDAHGLGLEGIDWQRQPARDIGRACGHRVGSEWHNRVTASRVCRGADGLPHRVERLRGLGNAVPPVMAQWIGERLMEAERAA
jgi:DNA (cytosine-5)-methyltransferase 1